MFSNKLTSSCHWGNEIKLSKSFVYTLKTPSKLARWCISTCLIFTIKPDKSWNLRHSAWSLTPGSMPKCPRLSRTPLQPIAKVCWATRLQCRGLLRFGLRLKW